jgi:hypothetical protein
MKTLLAIAIMLLPGAAWAGSQCQYIGSQLYCSDDSGGTINGSHIGNTDYYTGTTGDGRSWQKSCYNIGTTRYCD